MKKDIAPLMAAIFLVIGGLASSSFSAGKSGSIVEVASAHHNGEFFITAAQGAETAGALLGERLPSPVSAISNSSILESRSIFFVSLGAVKDPGIFAANGLAH